MKYCGTSSLLIRQAVTIPVIQQTVIDYFGIEIDDLKAQPPYKKRNLSPPDRHVSAGN